MGEVYLNNTFGAMLLGAVLTGCMYGVTTTQTYTYFVMPGSVTDNKYLRMLIFFLWTLDTFHTGVITAAAYAYLVTDFGNLLAASRPTWTIFPATVLSGGLSNGLVRSVLCYRVWCLSGRSWLLLIAFGTPVLVTMASTFAYAIMGIYIKSWLDLYKISWLLVFSFAWSMAADVIISASLYVLLALRKTGFPSSDNIVRKLIIYSVNTGAISSLCALLCLVTYVTMKEYFVFMPFYCVYPKLLLNCLLATLNSRPALKEQLASTMAPKSDPVRHLVVETITALDDVEYREASIDRTPMINLGYASHVVKTLSSPQSSRADLETLR